MECRLAEDPPLKGHKFGRRMIRLAVNLARVVGLRPTERVLKIVWEWLGVQQQLPDWTTIRTWLLRIGLAALREPVEAADDWIWMADHSNQIGPEKALVVLGVRASKLPPRGETLKHEDVRLLTVRPGTAWKREDMAIGLSRTGRAISDIPAPCCATGRWNCAMAPNACKSSVRTRSCFRTSSTRRPLSSRRCWAIIHDSPSSIPNWERPARRSNKRSWHTLRHPPRNPRRAL